MYSSKLKDGEQEDASGAKEVRTKNDNDKEKKEKKKTKGKERK